MVLRNLQKIAVLYAFLCSVFPLSTELFAQAPPIEWSKCYGGSLNELPTQIHQTKDGGYILVGEADSHDGDIVNDHGGGDIAIFKLDPLGNIEWKQFFGGTQLDGLNSVLSLTDGYIICGYTYSNDGQISDNSYTTSNYVVARLDLLGNIQWIKTYGGKLYDEGGAIIQVSDGFVICGNSTSSDGQVTGHHSDATYADGWVIKINNDGDLLWNISLGGSSRDNTGSLVLGKDNTILVAGFTNSTDGDFPAMNGGFDSYIVALSQDGKILWKRVYGGSDDDYGLSLARDSNSHYVLCGYTNSRNKLFAANRTYGNEGYVICLDSIGNPLWTKLFGGSNDDKTWSISTMSNGNLFVTGETNSNDRDIKVNHGGYDLWALELSPTGNVLWDSTYGGSSTDYGGCGIEATNGGFIISGYTQSPELPNYHGAADFWVVKLGCISTFSVDRAVIFNSTYSLCSASREVVHFTDQFCASDGIVSVQLADPNYTIKSVSHDSVVIAFTPLTAGQHNATALVELYSKSLNLTKQQSIQLQGTAIDQTMALHFSDASIRQDTIGGSAHVPIILHHPSPLDAFNIYYHYDTVTLRGSATHLFHVEAEQSGAHDTLGYLDFEVFPQMSSCLEIVIDSVSATPGCTAIETPAALCITTTPQCGNTEISQFMKSGKIDLVVTPNPAKKTISLSQPLQQSVSIINSLGRTVLQVPPNTTMIDISTLVNGVYSMTFPGGVVRFIKE